MCYIGILTACRPKLVSLVSFANFSSTSTKLKKSYYDALGITPKATQNDIKAAYYKLSMKYHPDKNKDSEEAIQKFRSITEAYEVLGNFRLKKLYDKGLLHTAGSGYEASAANDEETNFYKSRFKRDKPPPSGRTPIYNFDEWSRAHYGDTFARRKSAKARYEQGEMRRRSNAADLEVELILLASLMFSFTLIAFSYVTKDSYDNDAIDEREDESHK